MDEHTFQQGLVLSAIAKGARTLQEIADVCGGLYPGELRSLIEELIFHKKVLLSSQGYSLAHQEKTGDSMMPSHEPRSYYAELPEPHPHDYDWRFDTATAQHLANTAIQESSSGGTILLLGIPSVFIELVYSNKASHTILLDWSSELIDYLSHFHLPSSFDLVKHDLLSGQLWHGNSPVGVVVCDPPWYIEHYAAFLAQAASASRLGARIIVSLLPPDTRPGAIADRWEIFKIAHKLGLDILSIDSGAIRYKTPAFEQASLYSTSIDIKKNWRVGDLVTFGKMGHPSWETIAEVLTSATSIGLDPQEWAEIILDRYKVKLRGPFNDYSEKPELLSIEKDDTLPTVSRRYKGRESIDLWLWNNRVFAVRGKAAFLAALYILDGRPIPDALQRVPEGYLGRALALLIHRAEILDFQTNEVWKVTRREEKYNLGSYRFTKGVGTG